VKAFVNDGRSRYYGVEGLLRFSISSRWTLQGHYSFIVGRDLDPNRPARRLPPQMGSSTLRYTPTGRRPWFEISLTAAGAQRLLSGGDIDDERIGASLRRRDIQDFFTGSRVAPYLNGAVFTPTGETLAQLQNRVLPIGVFVNGVRVVNDTTRVPLYLSTAGWCTLNARSGFSLGERWQVIAALENLLDRNYRFHGSGFDAPGISAYLSLAYRF
jgi:outer membrane receptor protein involved in Fe transport